jgi:beta-phosphoglucomutase
VDGGARRKPEIWAANPRDAWKLVHPSKAQIEAHEETLFALSDGWLGVRAGPEECPGQAGAAFIADVYEQRPIDYHERFPGFARSTDTRVPVADGKRIAVRLGAGEQDLSDGGFLGGWRELDLATGRLVRTADWRAPGGEQLIVTVERIACLRRPGLYPLRFNLQSTDYSGPVRLDALIDTGHRAADRSDDPRIGVQASALPLVEWRSLAGALIAVQAVRSRGLAVLCGQMVVGGVAARKGDALTVAGRLAPGGRMTLEKIVAYEVCAQEDVAAAAERLEARLAEAAALGFDALAEEQAAELAAFWAGAHLSIHGDPALEQALRFNLFHLRQSADASGQRGLSVKGLTGEGYEGHVFWDAEAFMLPALACLEPDLARAHLEYRCRHLDGARAHAREMNFASGALYPWRTIAGAECSSYFLAGSAQLHINAAIARAVGLYLEATGDFDFIADQAGEMLFETARIWLEAGFFDERRDGAFSICGVTGPDEYSVLVDNNLYTNLSARSHLTLACDIADRLEAERPAHFAALAARIGLTSRERRDWAAAAAAMRVPYDAALGVHAQDDAFLDKPRFDLAAAEERRPLLLHYHPLTLYRSQVCKQADAILALVTEGEGVSLEQKRRDYDYYTAITAHDSTLSASVFAILAAEINAPDDALRFFRQSVRIDLDNLHDNTHHGAHLAAMAGGWLTLVRGFAGLRTAGGRLSFTPRPPPDLGDITLRLRWRGSTLEVGLGARTVEYRLLAGATLEIEHEGEPLRLIAGGVTRRPWGRCAPLEAVIFDLDGVLTDTATAHFRAWRRLAAELGFLFGAQANEALKGVDRMTSLDLMLRAGGVDPASVDRPALAARKNAFYLEEIADLGPGDLLPGARAALQKCRGLGLKTALASASRNAPQIIARLGIADLFDAVAEVTQMRRAKPAPDLFLAAAAAVGVRPARCLAVEDSVAGVAAIRAAGMTSVGVGDPAVLRGADIHISDMTRFRPGRPEEFASSEARRPQKALELHNQEREDRDDPDN